MRNTVQKRMETMSDEALFMKFVEGDAASLEELVERIRAPLLRTIMRHVGNTATAEDVFQDALERVIRHKKTYDPSKPVRGWIWSIAINRSVDYLRRGGREIFPEVLPERTDGATPESLALSRQSMSRINAAILSLPVEQREVFLMREEAGLSFAQISEATGAPLGTVLSRMNYALKKLRDAVEDLR